jgi:hypothetical protein
VRAKCYAFWQPESRLNENSGILSPFALIFQANSIRGGEIEQLSVTTTMFQTIPIGFGLIETWFTRVRISMTGQMISIRARCKKMNQICTKLELRPGETFIDIGCGWGGRPHCSRGSRIWCTCYWNHHQ